MPLYNIFTKKGKKKSGEAIKPRITADIHEKNSLVLGNLAELGAELELTNLQVGDYLINDIIIERKTFQDFISSMLSKRLIQQLINMQQYPKKLLILEGKENELFKDTKLHPNAIRGMILSTCLEMQTPVIFSKDEQETASYLFLLAKKQLKPKQELSFHSRIPRTKKEQKQYILESFPNIGPKTAEKLLKKFKTIKKVINSSQAELEEVIGKKAEAFKLTGEEF